MIRAFQAARRFRAYRTAQNTLESQRLAGIRAQNAYLNEQEHQAKIKKEKEEKRIKEERIKKAEATLAILEGDEGNE